MTPAIFNNAGGKGKSLDGLPNAELMRRIKSQFDPAGILNPGKIFDL